MPFFWQSETCKTKLGMLSHTCNPSTEEKEAVLRKNNYEFGASLRYSEFRARLVCMAKSCLNYSLQKSCKTHLLCTNELNKPRSSLPMLESKNWIYGGLLGCPWTFVLCLSLHMLVPWLSLFCENSASYIVLCLSCIFRLHRSVYFVRI